MTPGRFEKKMRKLIFKLILMIGGWGIFCKIVLRWMTMDLTDEKSTLVQVMAWCSQATNHYLIQCWPRSMSPYGVSRPQWVNSTIFPTPFSKAFSWMKMYEFLWKISQNFVPLSPINNNPALVQIMAWRRPGDKPLSEPIMVSLLRHTGICVTQPLWVKR